MRFGDLHVDLGSVSPTCLSLCHLQLDVIWNQRLGQDQAGKILASPTYTSCKHDHHDDIASEWSCSCTIIVDVIVLMFTYAALTLLFTLPSPRTVSSTITHLL